MPARARRVAASVAALGLMTVLPTAARGACVPPRASGGVLAVRLASPAPAAVLAVRVPARRPACGVVAWLPRIRLTVVADGGRVAVLRGTRTVAAVRAPSAAVTATIDPLASRLRLTAGRRALSRRLVIGPPGPVRAAAGVRVSAVPPSPPDAATAALPAPFAPDSVFRAPLGAGTGVAPDSAAVAADLAGQARRLGARVDHRAWSVPVYVVPPDQPRVDVRDAGDGPRVTRAGVWSWGRVPLPPAARPGPPAAGERPLVVWQPATDTMWEFSGFRRTPAGPVADRGARIAEVSRNPGTIQTPWGATSTGIPLAAGLVTATDLASGRIDHAVALGVPEMRALSFRPPAVRSDGTTWRATAPEAGMRLRLDPSVDVTALGVTPFGRMVAEAARTHGLVLRDTAGAVTVWVEDPQPWGRDLLGPVLAGHDPASALAGFPWDRLQVVE